MKRLILLLGMLLIPVGASAQVGPGAFTILTTTSTTADSLRVGCAVGTTTCTGGIKAGGIVSASGNVVLTTGNLTVSAGDINATSGTLSVATVSASGTVTAATFSGSGASLTSIPETAITDGSILARVAAGETISGQWSFTANPFFLNVNPLLAFSETDQGSNLKNWVISIDSQLFQIQTRTDAFGAINTPVSIDRGGGMAVLGGISAGSTITAGTNVVGVNGVFTTSVSANTLTSAGGQFELGRGIAQGAVNTRGFSAGNYTGVGGAWTVGSGDVSGESWRLVGGTMWFSARLITTTIAASTTQLRITLPLTSQDNVRANCVVVDGATGTAYVPTCGVDSGGTYLYLFFENGAAFITGTDNQSIYVNLTFNIV
jgi:hypothetical protein